MKKIIQIFILCLILIPLPFTSCVDVAPEEVIDYKDFYSGLDDADAAILGLYGQFMDLAGQVVVLNELRADLMDVTERATADLQEINLNAPSKNNPWTNVSKFYGVIQTCNDMLYNFDKMLKEKKMIQAEYDERYSDVAALRTWVYLQLGIHFGKVPYITEPIVSPDDVEKYKNNEMDLDRLIPELIRCMENLPTLENYQSSKLIQSTVDGYSLQPFFIHKRCLLGDLYLFNNDYQKAAEIYRQIMSIGENLAAGDRLYDRKYRLYCAVWNSGTPDWFQILYRDGKYEDETSLYNAWREMFLATTTGRSGLEEMIWLVSYDMKFAPAYPFPEMFNPAGYNKGKYYLKPSDYAVESVWGGEVQKNDYPFDARGLTGAFEKGTDNQYYIRKYSYIGEANTGGLTGDWFLYRTAMLHLRYAEAANRAGYPKLAWAIVNSGLGTAGSAFAYKREDGSDYPADSIRFTGYDPDHPYPQPYYFDGRYSDQPRIRGPWRDNGGVRGRANLPDIPFPDNIVTKQDSILFVEKMIVHESALELGFEGHRWEDLIRIARRWNKETPGAGNRFLWNDNIEKKYRRSGIVGTDLSSEEKWFLPLYQ